MRGGARGVAQGGTGGGLGHFWCEFRGEAFQMPSPAGLAGSAGWAGAAVAVSPFGAP